MKIFLDLGRKPDRKSFGGSIGRMEAELTDDLLDGFDLRAPLAAFGAALATQMRDERAKTDSPSEVIGVDVVAIDFTLILQRKPL